MQSSSPVDTWRFKQRLSFAVLSLSHIYRGALSCNRHPKIGSRPTPQPPKTNEGLGWQPRAAGKWQKSVYFTSTSIALKVCTLYKKLMSSFWHIKLFMVLLLLFCTFLLLSFWHRLDHVHRIFQNWNSFLFCLCVQSSKFCMPKQHLSGFYFFKTDFFFIWFCRQILCMAKAVSG